jgi:hypothetical protein
MDAGNQEASGDWTLTQLASYRHCVDRIEGNWAAFSARRRQRLRQGLFDGPVEKVAENILEDLFTMVLDWSLADVNLQVGRADVVLSELGIKRVVLEVKRPGTLIRHRRAVEAALDQGRHYAAEQKVGAVAVSDAHMLYAADVTGGGLHDRVLVALDAEEAPRDLWWVSVHGIYRPGPINAAELTRLLDASAASTAEAPAEGLVHPKYHLPSRCFAYVGAANKVHTWKLPYLLENGVPDTKRLPKAIQSMLSNYRGAKVDIPREEVGDILVRLAIAAATLRKLPCQCAEPSPASCEAHHALEQLGRLGDVRCCS